MIELYEEFFDKIDCDDEEIRTSVPEKFVVNDDFKAEWVLKKIRESDTAYIKLVDACKQQLDYYTYKLNRYDKAHKDEVERLTAMLIPYFDTVPHKATKTKESYKLPSGQISYIYEKESMSEPEDTAGLVGFMKENGYDDFIKVKESPMWGDFKKHLSIVNGNAVTRSGLIVECVTVETKPGRYEAKPDKQ